MGKLESQFDFLKQEKSFPQLAFVFFFSLEAVANCPVDNDALKMRQPFSDM